MAQRKSTPATSKGRAPASAKGRGAAPSGPSRRPGRSIVNQRQTPWGLIITTVIIVIFAVGIVGYAVAQGGKKDSSSSASKDSYSQPELPEAKKIQGLTYQKETDHEHVSGVIDYDATPPVGGKHSQYWGDCSGTVYDQPIANENAVHMLEHGAVWITYNAKTLPADQLAVLKKLVEGVDRMALSPYPDLKSPISLQTWGYQLFVDNANDPRVEQFINTLRYNPKTTPEYGATCAQPSFKQHPSTFGHPLWLPADGGAGNTHP